MFAAQARARQPRPVLASLDVRRLLLLLVVPLALALGCKREAPSVEPPPPAPSAPAEPLAELRYLERTTFGASPTDRLPLIIAIHGRGDSPERYLRLFDGFPAKARVVTPFGPDPYQGGYSWFPSSSPRLNLDNVASGTERAAHRLATLIGTLEKQRPTAGRPIVTGFSQGGMLSFTLAVLHPEVLGEAYPVAGLLAPLHWPSSWAPGKIEPRLVSFHGEADHVVPVEVDRQSVDRLRAIGFDATLHTYPGVDHTITPEIRRDLFQALEEAVKRASAP